MPAPSHTIHPAWTPPQGGHIFQPPSPTGRPPPQVPSASHLGLHPLPTGTLRKQGQPRPRAPSGKGGGQVPSRLLLKGVQAPETPSLPGHCLAGQGICLGPGFGGGHGVCARPLPWAPFAILQGSRPLTDQVESSPVGPEPGQGPGKIKDPTEACSPVVGNGRRTESVLGRRGTAWHVVPPGTPSPLLGTRDGEEELPPTPNWIRGDQPGCLGKPRQTWGSEGKVKRGKTPQLLGQEGVDMG